MEEKLTKLYNTMLTIETKGTNTKTMADCLRFLENVIVETRNSEIGAITEEVEP